MARWFRRPSPPACNLCGGTNWGDQVDRVGVRCLGCGSLERTRLLWMYLDRLHLRPGMRVLQIAPETAVAAALARRVGADSYEAADLFPELYAHVPGCRRIDLCHLDDEPGERYDLIVHSHVLEHVPCDVAGVLRHLHRMLAPTGWHVCIIPFMPGRSEEDLGDIGDEERNRRFGQGDHVRRFGADDADEHLGRVIRLPAVFDACADFGEPALVAANVPPHLWTGLHTATVLCLRRDDQLV